MNYLGAEKEETREFYLNEILSTLDLAISMREDRLFRAHSGSYVTQIIEDHVELIRTDEAAQVRLSVMSVRHPQLAEIMRKAS